LIFLQKQQNKGKPGGGGGKTNYLQHFSKPATHSEIQPELSYMSKLV